MYSVLIAEDNYLLGSALSSIISRHESFNVAGIAKNSEEIINKCQSEKIDMLFMNTIFQGKSSVELCREICESNNNISICIISLIKNDLNIKEFIKLGIKDYISLPVTFSKVGFSLNAYKERNQRKFGDPLITETSELIKSRDYTRIYDSACKVVDEIMKEGSDNFEKRLFDVVDGICHHIEVRCGIKVDIENRFPVDEALSQEEMYWKLWLSEVFDFALRSEAIYCCGVLDKLFDVVDECLFESIRLDFVCKECNISEGYLNKKMREYMGVSTMDYFNRRKMLEAKKMLCFRKSMLGDIAYDLGYNENSYFSKVFKKYEGISPIQFRKNIGRQGA